MIKDGKLIVMYDEKLDCIINGMGWVKDYIFVDIKKFDVGFWFNKVYLEKVKL